MYEIILQIAYDIIILGGALLMILSLIGATIWLVISIKTLKTTSTIQKTVKNISLIFLAPTKNIGVFVAAILDRLK